MTGRDWRLEYEVQEHLPRLAWLASIKGGLIRVRCGTSVRREPVGFFDGTWAGDGGLGSLGECATVFGSGIVIGETPVVVTPAHGQAGVFVLETADGALVANSLAGLLAGAGIELDRSVDYPGRFVRVIDGLPESPIELPAAGRNIRFHFHDNLRIRGDQTLVPEAKQREAPFASFADYRARLNGALRSALDNAPGYAPVIAASGGYDSTAVAVLAAENGCRRMVTFPGARRGSRGRGRGSDSGAPAGAALGMEVATFDRLEYLERADLPEAEFLATGFSGEDVVFSAFENHLERAVLITGGQGDTVWQLGTRERPLLSRSALDGCSLNEFRLRLDCIYVPLPLFGITEHSSIASISRSPEMRPWSVGGGYDKPIPRRMIEEAGITRGRFAAVKRAASSLIHTEGRSALGRATVASVTAFAAGEGGSLTFEARGARRLSDRALLRIARVARSKRLADSTQRRQRRRLHFEARAGNLLLRWGLAVVAARYASLAEVASPADPMPSA